jgi:hypothetical protein
MQANKKEREKAKRERKEARRLAEHPMPYLTEDAQPRACGSAAEQQDVDEWIVQRKLRFPTAANIKRRQVAAAAAAASGEPLACLCLGS